MTRNLETMARIQAEKAKEIQATQLPLDAEGKALAEHKRYTIDVIEIHSDPLR